ncbi:UNVERIFIED_CONTAM: hypothetical protein HDU68_001583 [Siphonaria sp. JEL0065]|nr:hypothetical protein HDU68_001583 [Siphonaria sp. JEL0065]
MPSQDATSNRKRYIIIGVAAVIVLGIAGGLTGYFVTKNKKSSSSNSGSSSSSGGGSSESESFNKIDYNLPVIRNQLIGYYGQNAVANGVNILNGTNSRVTSVSNYQDSLAHYCSTGYYNTINLAFMNIFGNGDNHFTITFSSFNLQNYGGKYVYTGNGLETNPQYIVQNFIKVGLDIQTCQAQGVKIVISLGGDKTSAYSFSQGDGKRYANLFYNMFLDGTDAKAIRPFGPGVKLDGIELDVEKNDNPAVWNPEMIDFIYTLRNLSPKTILAIVPQCYLGLIGKDESVGDVIAATSNAVDYIIVQYYNNPQCSYPFGFNFDKWKALFPRSIVVGLAGDWTSAISGGFLEAGPLQAVYEMVKNDPQFGGFSIYDVSSSNPPAFAYNQVNYLNPPVSQYSQTVKNVLNGVIVGSGFPPQGAQQNNLLLANRCGGTWVYANSNCTLKVCDPAAPNPGCGVNQQCFSFLATTCPASAAMPAAASTATTATVTGKR